MLIREQANATSELKIRPYLSPVSHIDESTDGTESPSATSQQVGSVERIKYSNVVGTVRLAKKKEQWLLLGGIYFFLQKGLKDWIAKHKWSEAEMHGHQETMGGKGGHLG